jgi:hypothetical protein
LLVNVGHGRDPVAAACAARFVRAWEAEGYEVGSVVSWPPTAASYLRAACRLAAGTPDAWVVADSPEGWAPVAERLAAVGTWLPARTVGFSMLAVPRLAGLTGAAATEGLSGSLRDGRTWTFRRGVFMSGTAGPAAVGNET